MTVEYRAGFDRVIHGQRYKMVDRTRRESAAEAVAIAETKGENPTAVWVDPPNKDPDAERGKDIEAVIDDANMLKDMGNWEHGRIAAAVQYARVVGALGAEPLPRDPAKWKAFVRGVVWAADWYLRERPDRAAKLAEIGTTAEAKR